MKWYWQAFLVLICDHCGASDLTTNLLNIAPFGQVRYWTEETGILGRELALNGQLTVPRSSEDEWNIGLTWHEHRDLTCLAVVYDKPISTDFAAATRVQYWFNHWPLDPPRMPKIEDRVDDPWQGQWLTALTNVHISGDTVVYTFPLLMLSENSRADRLPGTISYRNALKIRLLYKQAPPAIKTLSAYTPTEMETLAVRIEFCHQRRIKLKGDLSVFNGYLSSLSGWRLNSADGVVDGHSWCIKTGVAPKGIIAHLKTAKTVLPGSSDQTIVTVRMNSSSFSFNTADLKKGAIYIPSHSVYITKAADKIFYSGSEVMKGKTIREQLRDEPEQTFQRARAEIPELDPTNRQYTPNRLWLPLAADASWQKFALEWGGNFYMSKKDSKVKGKELARCRWKDDVLRWDIGTGHPAEFSRPRDSCQVSILNRYLPIVTTRWRHQGFMFEQEALVTLLQGPLSPDAPDRSEQTPAVLMLKLSITNPGLNLKHAHLWLKGLSVQRLHYSDGFLWDESDGEHRLRLFCSGSVNAQDEILRTPADTSVDNTLHRIIEIASQSTFTQYLYVPFVGDLDLAGGKILAELDYDHEFARVKAYWENIVNERVVFHVPEAKFNEMARAVIPHIRIGVTKDPKSGLYMVPAASFKYPVYANESCFQAFLLDRMGDHDIVSKYMQTFIQLQGSKPFEGSYTGDQSAVFHGAKVDDEYDYTAHEYNLDHGTVLWALGRHFLYTRDIEWLRRIRPNILKACDWIIEQCRNTMTTDRQGVRVLHYGLLPAGHLEDNDDWGYWFANNAYACLGLQTAAKVFHLAGFAEADRLEKCAVEFRINLRSAVQRSTELCPVVRLRNNIFIPYVPTRPYQRFRNFGPIQVDYFRRYGLDINPNFRLSATREVLYGPMILISTGIIDAHEQMADWILDDWEDNATMSTSMGLNVHGWVDDEYWFSRGGMVFQPNLQNPILAYLLRHENSAAIRHVYNNMVASLYPDVNAFSEEYRMWGSAAGPFYKSADEARFVHSVCDLLVMESGNELWLAPGTPRRWLEPGHKIELKNAATFFGKVSYILQQGPQPNSITARIECPNRNRPTAIRLFIRSPFNKPIKSVIIDGIRWEQWEGAREVICLPTDKKSMHIIVSY